MSVQALTTDGHAGRSYRLSGPQALRPGDRLEILARVLRRPLRFEPLSDEQARAEMTADMPAEYVDAMSPVATRAAELAAHVKNSI